MPKRHKKRQKMQKVPKSLVFLPFSASFWQHIQFFFVTGTLCNKQKLCLLQWLSVTNQTNLCRSDSVWQTTLKKISDLFVGCDKGIKINPKKHIFTYLNFTIALGYLTRKSYRKNAVKVTLLRNYYKISFSLNFSYIVHSLKVRQN